MMFYAAYLEASNESLNIPSMSQRGEIFQEIPKIFTSYEQDKNRRVRGRKKDRDIPLTKFYFLIN